MIVIVIEREEEKRRRELEKQKKTEIRFGGDIMKSNWYSESRRPRYQGSGTNG